MDAESKSLLCKQKIFRCAGAYAGLLKEGLHYSIVIPQSTHETF